MKEKKLENHFYLHKKGEDLLVTQPLHKVIQTAKRTMDDEDTDFTAKREKLENSIS